MGDAWMQSLGEFAGRFARAFVERLPGLLGAAVLILAGYLLGRLIRSWSRRLIASGVDRFVKDPDARGELERTGMRRLVPEFTGLLLFWVVFIFFAAAAVEVLGLPVISNLISVLAAYLPNVVAAVAIVFIGLLGSLLARGTIVALFTRAGVSYGNIVGQTVQVAILLVALVTGIDQIGIDSTFLIIVAGIVIATMLGAAALAFAFGAGTSVSNILASHYAQRAYRPGQSIRIGNVEGRIIEITPTTVVIQSSEGRVVIPAKKFNEEVSVLLDAEG